MKGGGGGEGTLLAGEVVLSQTPWEVEFPTGGRPRVKGAGGPRPRPVSSFRTEWPGTAWLGLGTRPCSLTGLPVSGTHGRSSAARGDSRQLRVLCCLPGLAAPLPQVVGSQESGPV